MRALRRKIALEIGLIIPPVRTRDNVDLGPGEYAITVHGVEMGNGRAPSGHVLVIAEYLDNLPGPSTVEPVFGLPAKWLPVESRALAEAMLRTLRRPLPPDLLRQAAAPYTVGHSVTAHLEAFGLTGP